MESISKTSMPVERQRLAVYVDGFNLYYGALKGHPTGYKWLNLYILCDLLRPGYDISIKYFTARVSARSSDPDQPVRQQAYLRALETIPNLEIVFGRFLSKEVTARLARPPLIGSGFVQVLRTDEKGSDVNLAVHLIHDGFKKRYDAAIVISNDSDLAEAVRIVRDEIGVTIGVFNPGHAYKSAMLRAAASFQRPIREGVIRASQFPDELADVNGKFQKPSTW